MDGEMSEKYPNGNKHYTGENVTVDHGLAIYIGIFLGYLILSSL